MGKNLEKYKRLQLDYRVYETRVNRTISKENMMSINSIVGRYLDQALKENGPFLWDLNLVYYSAAVTVLHKEGLLKELRTHIRT